MLKTKIWAVYALLMLGLLAGCKDPETVTPASANQNASTDVTHSVAKVNSLLYDIMKEVYLWDDQLPKTFNASQYKTPEDALEALKYKTYDRWSYIEDLQTFLAYFEGGEYVGNGLGLKLDADRNLWVSYVYPNSPAGKAGLSRGYKITKINGQDVSALLSSNTINTALGADKAGEQTRFSMVDPAGAAKSITLSKEAVTINSVLQRDVKQVGNKKVGYLVFTTFIDKSNAELDEAFAYFKNQDIDELVLDLRYNGGGSLSVAQHLASLIAPSKANQKFVELTFNAKNQQENEPYNFESVSQGINLNRLFVITTGNTASASEAVINGLRSYMPVITIGSTSHGKPVGMSTFMLDKAGNMLKYDDPNLKSTEGYAFLPIMFKVANANGQADYFNGILADGAALDNVTVPFGDVKEDCFAQAAYYIQNGTFSGTLASGRRAIEGREPVLPMDGFRAEIGAF